MADKSIGIYEVTQLSKMPTYVGAPPGSAVAAPTTTYNATLTAPQAESGIVSQVMLQDMISTVALFATGEVNIGEKYEVILREVVGG